MLLEERTDTIWDRFRSQMPITEKWAYFDHAAVAPITRNAQQALHRWTDQAALGAMQGWGAWRQQTEEVRNLGATLLGAKTEEIALVHNTTEGINFVVEGFPWKEGDNVVTLSGEFPTNYIPWRELKAKGVELRVVPTDRGRVSLSEIAEAFDDRTRLLTLSWVNYVSGWRHDLKAISDLTHSRNAYLMVDAIQGLGVLPIDVESMGIDFLSADGHKWLLGPEGAGFFYVKQDLLNLLRPIMTGWNSVEETWSFDKLDRELKQNASRYEGGTANHGLITALGESLKLLLDIGVDNIEQRLLALNEQIRCRLEQIGGEVLSPRKFENRSGIVSVRFDQVDASAIQRACREQGVLVNSRGGAIRISPHLYTNGEEIDRLIDAIESATASA
ncbi:Cysteine desulfurase [Polystyrenella longa]|uniref:Cysteine desulfurase n=1 Tax=Polystyrenella longa TaxID=2528007 RepID=A0A518CR03_9PLAN|nr:aminotransferase class V-fold PLP-dependent enzyme [Polystyrenella longa]QDU81661.1 Cysteine desulfurase [Polystyrenella longa]